MHICAERQKRCIFSADSRFTDHLLRFVELTGSISRPRHKQSIRYHSFFMLNRASLIQQSELLRWRNDLLLTTEISFISWREDNTVLPTPTYFDSICIPFTKRL
jgi:hypothetical protein